MIQKVMKEGRIVWMLALICTATAIDQSCSVTQPCPVNAVCNSANSMCVCNSNFIGNCSTPVIPLNTTTISVDLAANQPTLFSVIPTSTNTYIQFIFNLCQNNPQLTLTFSLWVETGNISSFTQNNVIGQPTQILFSPGCQNLTTLYIQFTQQQPNGQPQLLILGITDNSQSATITLSASQQTIVGSTFYFYLIVTAVSAIIIIIVGIAVVLVYRYRRRRLYMGGRGGPPHLATNQNQNNIQHFQQYMPAFKADQLGKDRSTCPICLQQVELAQLVRKIPCGHVFHAVCIDSWCLKNMSCPICRLDMSQASLQNPQTRPILNESAVLPNLPADWQEESESNREVIVPVDKKHEEQWSEQIRASIQIVIASPDDRAQIRQHML